MREFYGNKKSLEAKRLMSFSKCERSEFVWGPRGKDTWWNKTRNPKNSEKKMGQKNKQIYSRVGGGAYPLKREGRKKGGGLCCSSV